MQQSTIDEVLGLLGARRLVAVVRAPSARSVVGVATALEAGGITAIEVTFSTPGAADAIRELSKRPTLLVGAGTVTTTEQVNEALDAGARFLVSPHTDLSIVALGMGRGTLTIPGAMTPSEVVMASNHAPLIKLFPGSLGGPGYLRALRAPFPELRMMPTGGISPANAREWLEAGAYALGAGGDLCPRDLIEAGDLAEITRRARRYTDEVERWMDDRERTAS